jgi:CheY-like chemotaxis protein
VEMMGGEIHVQSEENVGSTFTFWINLHLAQEQIPLFHPFPADTHHVCIYDANEHDAKQLARWFEQLGVRSEVCADHVQVEQLLQGNHSKFDALWISNSAYRALPAPLLFSWIEMIARLNLPLIWSLEFSAQLSDIPDRLRQHIVSIITRPWKIGVVRDAFSRVKMADKNTAIPINQPAQQVFDVTFAESYPLKILIAEDNKVNQKLILKVLEKMGYAADVAENGEEAVHAVEKIAYDLIFMDMQMPVMDGIEATKQLVQQFAVPRRPYIVAMTANAMIGDREMCLDAGMDDYVSKPIRIEELRHLLVNWYEKRNALLQKN